jgi:hypothetical protein
MIFSLRHEKGARQPESRECGKSSNACREDESRAPGIARLGNEIDRATGRAIKGVPMFKSEALDELAKKISQAISQSPAKDLDRTVKAMLQSGLQRMNLVPREEFEIQAQVLARTREKLEALEARVAELEARRSRASRPKAP